MKKVPRALLLIPALFCALIVVMSMTLWPASVSAQPPEKNIYVDDDFLDTQEYRDLHMWRTIQDGIDDATDGAGDTVYVYKGTYYDGGVDGEILIDKRKLTIHGESQSSVTIVGNGLGPAMEITADTVTVRQLTISGGNPGVSWRNSGWGALENCTIRDNNSPGAIGLVIFNLNNQTIECINIYNNDNDGIQVTNSEMKDLIWNNITLNGNDGISLYNSTQITIARNISSNNGRHGIYIDDSASTTNLIYLNDFTGNTAGDGASAGSGNQWQTDGSPLLGNHWGDWSESGPYDLGSEQDISPLLNSQTTYPLHVDDPEPCTPYQAPPSPPGDGNGNGGAGGGGCFIATAAYGSYLDSHVETLRNFRDSYMVTNPVGSGLVSVYYKLSPPVADFIDEHPALKPIVRAGLLPAVAMSTVAVNTSPAEKAAIVGSLALISILLTMWRRQRSRRLGRS